MIRKTHFIAIAGLCLTILSVTVFAQPSQLKVLVDSADFYRTKNYTTANQFAKEGLTLAQKGSKEEAKLLFILGYTEGLLGNVDESLKHYLQGGDAYAKLKDTVGMVTLYNELTMLYHKQQLFPQSRVLNDKTIALAKAIDFKDQLANSYNNEGLLHLDLFEKVPGKNTPKEKQLDSAMAAFRRGYETNKEAGNKVGMSFSLDYMASTVMLDGRRDDALHYLMAAREIRLTTDDILGTAISTNNIGELYLEDGNPKEAIKWFRAARDSAASFGFKDLVAHTWRMEAQAQHDLGNSDAAYKALQEYQQIYEEMINEKKEKATKELQTKYDTQKKENENLLLTEENKIQALKVSRGNIIIVGLILASLLLGGIYYLLYNRYRLRQKAKLQDTLMQEQALRTAAVLDAEEAERQRLSRELHDGIGQMLAAARRTLQTENNIGKSEEKSSQPLVLLDESIKELRQLSHSMMPPGLRNKNLVQAVEELADRCRKNTGLTFHTEYVGMEKLELEKQVTLMLFRTIQEITNNAIKHAQATSLTIEMVNHETELTLMVYDDGIGFDKAKSNSDSSGLGLRNITSRVAFIGGKLNLDSSIGKGTTYIIELPLAAAEVA